MTGAMVDILWGRLRSEGTEGLWFGVFSEQDVPRWVKRGSRILPDGVAGFS